MNQTRKLIVLLLTVALLMSVLPVNGLAAYKVAALKLNQWYALQDYSDNMTIYRLRVTGETVVTLSWNSVKTADNYGSISVYREKTCDDSIAYCDVTETSSGSNAFVFYSGTYYIRMYNEKKTGKAKITTQKASAINKTNYCIGKAIALKAGKKVKIAQTKRFNYDRWYKFKVTKKQVISFYGLYESNFTLYDSNLNDINCSERKGRCITIGKQPAGTYYLRIYGSYFPDLTEQGNYIAFYWK